MINIIIRKKEFKKCVIMKNKDCLIDEVKYEKKNNIEKSLRMIIKENIRKDTSLISLDKIIDIKLNSDYKLVNKNRDIVIDVLSEKGIEYINYNGEFLINMYKNKSMDEALIILEKKNIKKLKMKISIIIIAMLITLFMMVTSHGIRSQGWVIILIIEGLFLSFDLLEYYRINVS
ncbi:hypothetical protein [Clostridium gasigenes]|uniref:Uncharacterized protein n=1 Tax=Clostridium gasigenes TaxID=94869 RepID=A0A1H0LTP7_9CLOT|nr:hypothetical protein [Clostridium gasigenes]SDO71421.1 hypothetical protein SAMN04488529_101196 [Clostridium gasigenes]